MQFLNSHIYEISVEITKKISLPKTDMVMGLMVSLTDGRKLTNDCTAQ